MLNAGELQPVGFIAAANPQAAGLPGDCLLWRNPAGNQGDNPLLSGCYIADSTQDRVVIHNPASYPQATPTRPPTISHC